MYTLRLVRIRPIHLNSTKKAMESMLPIQRVRVKQATTLTVGGGASPIVQISTFLHNTLQY